MKSYRYSIFGDEVPAKKQTYKYTIFGDWGHLKPRNEPKECPECAKRRQQEQEQEQEQKKKLSLHDAREIDRLFLMMK